MYILMFHSMEAPSMPSVPAPQPLETWAKGTAPLVALCHTTAVYTLPTRITEYTAAATGLHPQRLSHLHPPPLAPLRLLYTRQSLPNPKINTLP
jgi:hypothetical protein